MSYSREEAAVHIRQLKDLVSWRHYVQTLETEFNERVTALLLSDYPDEALRGECRALQKQLKRINQDSKP